MQNTVLNASKYAKGACRGAAKNSEKIWGDDRIHILVPTSNQGRGYVAFDYMSPGATRLDIHYHLSVIMIKDLHVS